MAAPYVVYAALDLLLLPLGAVILVGVLLRAGNRRNLVLVALVLVALAVLMSVELRGIYSPDAPIVFSPK